MEAFIRVLNKNFSLGARSHRILKLFSHQMASAETTQECLLALVVGLILRGDHPYTVFVGNEIKKIFYLARLIHILHFKYLSFIIELSSLT